MFIIGESHNDADSYKYNLNVGIFYQKPFVYCKEKEIPPYRFLTPTNELTLENMEMHIIALKDERDKWQNSIGNEALSISLTDAQFLIHLNKDLVLLEGIQEQMRKSGNPTKFYYIEKAILEDEFRNKEMFSDEDLYGFQKFRDCNDAIKYLKDFCKLHPEIKVFNDNIELIYKSFYRTINMAINLQLIISECPGCDIVVDCGARHAWLMGGVMETFYQLPVKIEFTNLHSNNSLNSLAKMKARVELINKNSFFSVDGIARICDQFATLEEQCSYSSFLISCAARQELLDLKKLVQAGFDVKEFYSKISRTTLLPQQSTLLDSMVNFIKNAALKVTVPGDNQRCHSPRHRDQEEGLLNCQEQNIRNQRNKIYMQNIDLW